MSPSQLSHIGERMMQIYHYARFANISIYIGQVSNDVGELPRTHMLVVKAKEGSHIAMNFEFFLEFDFLWGVYK